MLTELSVLYATIQLHGQPGFSWTSLHSDPAWICSGTEKQKEILGDCMVAEVERQVMREGSSLTP